MELAALQECLAAAERSFQEENSRAVGRLMQKQRRALEEYYQLARVNGASAAKHDVIESWQARGGSQVARRPETKRSLQRLTQHEASAARAPRRSASTCCIPPSLNQASSETQSEKSSEDEVLDQEVGELVAFGYAHTDSSEDMVQTTRVTPRNNVQRCLLPLVESRAFSVCSSVVVVLMCVAMCVDTHYRMKDTFLTDVDGVQYKRELSYVRRANEILAALFLIEMILRMTAEQSDFFCGEHRAWNGFDLIILSFAVIPWIVPGSERYMSCARIFRLARTIRLFEVFPDLRHMVFSIAACAQSMAWSLVLMTVLFVTFACYLMEVAVMYHGQISKCGECVETLRDEWSGMGFAVRALVYTITGGLDWGDLSRPFWRMSVAHGTVYMLFVLIAIFGLLNILVGVFVTKTEDIRSWDRDGVLGRALQSRNNDIDFFQQLFREIDTGRSGTIDEYEFTNALRRSRIQAYFHLLHIQYTDPNTLFKMMDNNENGELDIHEFTEACLRFQGAANTSDVVQVLQIAQSLDSKLTRLLGSHSQEGFQGAKEMSRRRFCFV